MTNSRAEIDKLKEIFAAITDRAESGEIVIQDLDLIREGYPLPDSPPSSGIVHPTGKQTLILTMMHRKEAGKQ